MQRVQHSVHFVDGLGKSASSSAAHCGVELVAVRIYHPASAARPGQPLGASVAVHCRAQRRQLTLEPCDGVGATAAGASTPTVLRDRIELHQQPGAGGSLYGWRCGAGQGCTVRAGGVHRPHQHCVWPHHQRQPPPAAAARHHSRSKRRSRRIGGRADRLCACVCVARVRRGRVRASAPSLAAIADQESTEM